MSANRENTNKASTNKKGKITIQPNFLPTVTVVPLGQRDERKGGKQFKRNEESKEPSNWRENRPKETSSDSWRDSKPSQQKYRPPNKTVGAGRPMTSLEKLAAKKEESTGNWRSKSEPVKEERKVEKIQPVLKPKDDTQPSDFFKGMVKYERKDSNDEKPEAIGKASISSRYVLTDTLKKNTVEFFSDKLTQNPQELLHSVQNDTQLSGSVFFKLVLDNLEDPMNTKRINQYVPVLNKLIGTNEVEQLELLNVVVEFYSSRDFPKNEKGKYVFLDVFEIFLETVVGLDIYHEWKQQPDRVSKKVLFLALPWIIQAEELLEQESYDPST